MLIDLFLGISSWLPYVKYVSIYRWLVIVLVLGIADTIIFLDWPNSIGFILEVAVLNLLVTMILIGGLCAPIEGIKSKYGKLSIIKPYKGVWKFNRNKKWYFSAWSVITESGSKIILITLGSEIKEVIPEFTV